MSSFKNAALSLAAAASLAAPALAAGDSDWASSLQPLTAPGASAPATPPAAAAPDGRPAAAASFDRRLMLRKGLTRRANPDLSPFGADGLPQLNYYGGPLLGSVKIQLVFWNRKVAYRNRLPGFYSTITDSPYFDWLSEYNTPSISIGRGSYLGAYQDSAPAPAKIEDADIQTELTKLISSGAVPAPGANTLYMVYFPPGMSIDMSGSGSCQVFCAYHSSFVNGSTEINYGVIPDQGGACAGGCGGDPSQFNNETSVSSHEMIEAVTNPAVGLATGNTPAAPLGWYDAANGEIGDICNAEQAQVSGYTVQRLWSNSRGLCVATASDPGAPFTPQAPQTGSSPIAKRP